MILLYTGATNSNIPQVNAANSLGGLVSSTGIPNGRFANLFPTIAKSTVVGNKSEIRLIALKNTTGAVVNNVKIFTNTTDKHIKLKLAAVAPFINSNSQPEFESVMDGYTLPFQAELNYHELEVNAIQIPSILAGATIGIWILREIDQSKFPEFNTETSIEDLVPILENSSAPIEESVQLSIKYD